MPFVQLVKPSAYFKRFQVKYRRRRQCKTDYKARRKLIQQDLTKYHCPKYRFVVRITNTDVICQVVYSLAKGDCVLASAYAHELKAFGAKAGFTNYAACYATGLLCSRRLLTSLNLAGNYQGNTKVTGDFQPLKPNSERRPFKAILDIGLVRTTTGARIFGALKGAVDGGIDIPHKPTRYAGYVNGKLDAKKHREKIFAVHVAEYMKQLKEKDPTKYASQFSQYVAAGLEHGAVEKMWQAVHQGIRKKPMRDAKEKKPTNRGVPKKVETKEVRDSRKRTEKAAITAGRVHRRTQKKEHLQRQKRKAEADGADE